MRSAARVLSWLDGQRGRPFFLFLHTFECHSPYVDTFFLDGTPSGRGTSAGTSATSSLSKRRQDNVARYDGEFSVLVRLDARDCDALRAQGLEHMDAVVMAIGEDVEASVLATDHLKQIGCRRVIARAKTGTLGHILKRVGADEVGSVLPRIRAPGRAPSVEAGPLSEMLEGYERQLIQAALDAGDGNIAEAARRLSTDRPNLYRRMKRLGIQRSADETSDT